MEKYSVLMSLYIKENPECFRTAIMSMLTQTAMPDEIVLVEDGPLTQELYAVIEEVKRLYPGVLTLVKNDTNLGLGIALQKGLLAARNELIARMDTDDISLPDRCEKQLKRFQEDSSLEMIGGDIAEFIDTPDNIVAYRRVPTTNPEIREYMKTRCPFNHMTVMYKRTSVLRSGNYQDWFWDEDYYLWIRMMEHGCVFANTGDVLVNVRTGIDMYSRRGGKKYFDSEIGLQKYMLNRHIIGTGTYIKNVAKRIIVQRILPNKIRGWVFRTFARS